MIRATIVPPAAGNHPSMHCRPLASVSLTFLMTGCFGVTLTGSDDGDFDESSGDAGADESTADGADGSGPTVIGCEPVYSLAGAVAGVDASYTADTVEAAIFDNAANDIAFDEIDLAMMDGMGLDRDDPTDRDRYAYFIAGFDFRNLYTEYDDEDYVSGLLPKVRRDLSIALYDLAELEVQPGVPVAVFDASALDDVRASGDLDAQGELLRTMIDEMRSNDQPDAIVAFAPDRSDEAIEWVLWIAMLSPNARFAAGGHASLQAPVDLAGEPVELLEYPATEVAAISIELEAEFAEGALMVSATCLPLRGE